MSDELSQNEVRNTVYWGKHYQPVAFKSCLNHAVSKDVLARARFISFLDYHKERRALKLC